MKGIKEKRKIAFRYHGNEREMIVSPYYLVICIGRYYMLCNTKGKENISQYRLDRMNAVRVLESGSTKIEDLQELDDIIFDVERYIMQHPRMSTGKIVTANLIVERNYIEAVQAEFFVEMIQPYNQSYYQVRIRSTRTAICNWVINMPGKVIVENDYGGGVIDLLCEKAKEVLSIYDDNYGQV